jgi:hypothetical protein
VAFASLLMRVLDQPRRTRGSGAPDVGNCEYSHAESVRAALPTWPMAPPRPIVIPGRCDVPRGTAPCGEQARLAPCGWRCDGHRRARASAA